MDEGMAARAAQGRRRTIMFSLLVGSIALLTACSGTATPGDAGASSATSGAEPSARASTAGGSWTDPFSPGEELTIGEWTISLGETDPDATPEVIAMQLEEYGGDESYTTPPGDGQVYVTVPVTATYTGTESDDPAFGLNYAYVSADGNTYADLVLGVGAPDDLSDAGELYPGGTATGNVLQMVEEGDVAGGVWRITENSVDSTAGEVFVRGAPASDDEAKESSDEDGAPPEDGETAPDGTPCVYVDGVCFSQDELDEHGAETDAAASMTLDDYLSLAPEEQSAVNSDLEVAGKFAEWDTANPLAPECLPYTVEGYGLSDLAEMGFGPNECPNE